MLRVPIEKAKSGMSLAMPVRNPQASDRYLLSSGYDLNETIVGRLKQMGVREVVVRYPGLEVLSQFIDGEVLEKRAEIAKTLSDVLERSQAQATAKLDYDTYLKQMAALVEQMLQNPSALLFIEEVSHDAPWLLEHSTTVSFLSLLMGMKLDWYLMKQRKRLPPRHAREVGSLGVGAMLHDIGMLDLEQGVLERYKQTGDVSDPAWRAHVRLGYERVRGQIDPTAAVVVLDHHQHFDGTGFPARRDPAGGRMTLKGEAIHIFARVTTVADTFATLREPYGGTKQPTVRAIRRMLGEPYVRWLDPFVLRSFLAVVPPFAPLKPVQLNDGRWAVPVDHSPDDPCRPTVQVIPGPSPNDAPQGGNEPPKMLDLREHAHLHVAHAEGEDVAADNFAPPRIAGNMTDLAAAYS
ncbi:MAG: HD domain-containing phosphohydrolase [Phycisphaeraceae bacterium]